MKRERIGLALATTAFLLALFVAAVVPGPAWAPGSADITNAPILNAPRVVSVQTGLAFAPRSEGVLVSTGDGGGAGLVEGLDAPLRVRASTFRGRDCWEIGTREGAPATYVDDNGIRLEDGMIDRLRRRAWPLPALLVLAAIGLFVASRRQHALARVGMLALVLAAAALVWSSL